MLTLEHASLLVELLDPAQDHDRFGVRYCTGGYVFQVHDAKHGPLLTGPTYPHDFNWFDGQGIPDAFNLGPIQSSKTPGRALVLGTGLCDLTARRVERFADWQVTRDDATTLRFVTEQEFESTRARIERVVTLQSRTLRSFTQLTNRGEAFVPMRWFPHPFYPQFDGNDPANDELLWVNAPLRWQEHPAYALSTNGFIRRRGWPWQDGHYCPLDHDATAPLTLLQRHPALGMVAASCSYVPTYFPIWGNAYTFSWEPFLERMVAPGRSTQWWIDYHF